ncbi:MAG TPA: hypothetical protein VF178_01615 [Gemmatimonadaceae bacterium]
MSSTIRPMREGLVVGLIAYVAVALFYAAFDILAARGTLYTVDLLGKAVFRGLRDPGVLFLPSQPDVVAIFWYNALHFVLALAIGLVVTSLVAYAATHPSHAWATMGVVAAGFVVTIALVGVVSTPIRPVLPWWSIVLANTLASVLAGTYLLARHPGLLGRLFPRGASTRPYPHLHSP